MNPFPKIIHQTWKTQDIPEVLRFCTDSWKKLNPRWQYILWTDESMDGFVRKHYPQIHAFYRTYPHNIFRADLFRLLVAHRMGGVYVDLDMECLKSLDFLFEHHVNSAQAQVVLSFEPPAQSKPAFKISRMYQAIFLAAKPGSPILDTLIRACVAKGSDHVLRDVVFVTGPAALTHSLNTMLPDKRICVLDYKIISPILDISNDTILRFHKRSSYKMILKREFYPESCMVHYWHHAYWHRKPILACSREQLQEEWRKSRNILYTINDLRYRFLPPWFNGFVSKLKKFLGIKSELV